jgi:hypothetical protein
VISGGSHGPIPTAKKIGVTLADRAGMDTAGDVACAVNSLVATGQRLFSRRGVTMAGRSALIGNGGFSTYLAGPPWPTMMGEGSLFRRPAVTP